MRAERAAAGGAILSGMAASACCIGPLVFGLVGISGAAAAGRLEPWRPYFLALTYALLGGAFYLTYRPQKAACGPGEACERPRTNAIGQVVLWLAAVTVLLVTAFPYYAAHLAGNGRAEEPLAKATLTIKGMTCGGCVAAVKLQLEHTDGVTASEVSLERAEAQVSYDPRRTDPARIAESVSTTGFIASVAPPKGAK